MYFDRFDICSAYYLYGAYYHAGQFSKEYAYMGRVLNCGFHPSLVFDIKSLSENAREIFDKLVEDNDMNKMEY